MFSNLRAACETHGPEGFKHICPESLEAVADNLDHLPRIVTLEFRTFMQAGREFFAPAGQDNERSFTANAFDL